MKGFRAVYASTAEKTTVQRMLAPRCKIWFLMVEAVMRYYP